MGVEFCDTLLGEPWWQEHRCWFSCTSCRFVECQLCCRALVGHALCLWSAPSAILSNESRVQQQYLGRFDTQRLVQSRLLVFFLGVRVVLVLLQRLVYLTECLRRAGSSAQDTEQGVSTFAKDMGHESKVQTDGYRTMRTRKPSHPVTASSKNHPNTKHERRHGQGG